jgi:hypothetical protein
MSDRERAVIEAARVWLQRIDDLYPVGGPTIGQPEREALRSAIAALERWDREADTLTRKSPVTWGRTG